MSVCPETVSESPVNPSVAVVALPVLEVHAPGSDAEQSSTFVNVAIYGNPHRFTRMYVPTTFSMSSAISTSSAKLWKLHRVRAT